MRSTDCVANLNALAAAGHEGVFEKLPDAAGQLREGAAKIHGGDESKKGGARKPKRK